MDNLTHSLIGAILGRAGLKRLTPRAMPALILSANLPDIDSFVAPLFGIDALGEHRGFTHGIGGLAVMPFVAAAIILLWEKLLPGKEWSVKPARLLLAGFLGTLSHPVLDLMNTYGVRLLAPFSPRWFYGDALFIMDPWIWIMLILGLELSWRAERMNRDWQGPARWAIAAVLGYIAINAAISARAVALTRPLVENVAEPRMIVAGEIPLQFWKRRMVWRGQSVGGFGDYDLLKGLNHARLDPRLLPLNLDDPRLPAAAKRNSRVRGFLSWSRMPLVVSVDGQGFLTDQRFHDSSRGRRRGAFLIPLDNPRPSS